MTAPAAFELHGVSVTYDGQPALEGIDLRIEPGEAVAFVGPSGAGKSTALRLLNAGVFPTAGRVCIDGEDLAVTGEKRMRELRSRVGFIPQDLGLVPNLRVSQNVIAGRLGRAGFIASLRTLLLPRRGELDEVLAILDRLGVGEKLFHRVDSLSGGEKQRVAIARALYQEAGALLADEPLSSLDPARSRETIALLVQVAQEHSMTLVLSMHDIELAREFLPRLIGLRRGRVRFDLATEDVPAEMLTELYQLEEQELIG